MLIMSRLSRTVIAALLAVGLTGLGAGTLAGCSSGQQSASQQPSSTTATAPATSLETSVIQDEDFGGIYFDITIDDFNKSGFAFGDSVDIACSNGFELTDLPYYNGYYVSMGDPLLVGYPGYPHVKAAINCGDPLWDISGLSEGDTATITLREAGAHLDTQEALSLAYTDERSDYDSDEQFANFRAATGGSMKQGILYRSASPVDNEHNRAAYVENLMGQAGVAFVLDLSDDSEEVDEFVAESTGQGVDVSRFTNLRNAGCVAMLNLSASYSSDKYAQSLAAGLVNMTQHEGPYLAHCVEGKDRTGFVCVLLEALCGATYDELLADYMKTYNNYYDVTQESNPDQFKAISDLYLGDMLRFLTGSDSQTDLTAIDYAEPARTYLRNAGLTDEQIDAVVAKLTR